jgi:hypothetical protein
MGDPNAQYQEQMKAKMSEPNEQYEGVAEEDSLDMHRKTHCKEGITVSLTRECLWIFPTILCVYVCCVCVCICIL